VIVSRQSGEAHELLDHILVSKRWWSASREWTRALESRRRSPRIVPPGRDEPVSDHLPVVARFQLD
jgi:hypothetical protein